MDDLIADFIAETREMLEALGGEIVAWEAAPQDRARLDAIFRFVHTVKGNSGFFELPRITALAHAAEDALAECRVGKRECGPPLVSAVLAIIDRLGELVQALESKEELAGDEGHLIDALSEETAPGEIQVAAAPGGRAAARTIRLPVELLDRLMSGVSDLVLARNELARYLRDAPAAAQAAAAFERVSASIGEMREAVTKTRMQRIDNLFASLPRLVRDLAAELGKQVVLTIDGGDVELDREMIETIRDPLTHIIRNAIDHGIEDAAGRRSAGKPAAGALQVCACQAGNQILIEVSDDGRGIDGERLADKAVAAGLISQAQAERMTAAQKLALVFEPGLSTAGKVTAISGRGVGMDVVRANIERIGGLVEIDSRRGEGLSLTLKVPLTLTIIPALTVGIAGQIYAIPRSAIEEIVRVQGEAVRIEAVGGAGVATIRGQRLPMVSLGKVLGLDHEAAPEERSLILIKAAGAEPFALAVDRFHDHEEVVVKPAAPAVMATGLYAGTTLAEDGKPVLLLDPPGLAAQAGIAFAKSGGESEAPAPAAREEAPAILFRALGGQRRAIPLAAVERIEDLKPGTIEKSAGRLHVAIGERILPLAGCGDEVPDQPIRAFLLSDGSRELAFGFAEVIDIVPLGPELLPAATPGLVRGVTLVEGEQTELIDLYWLFENEAALDQARRPVCVLAEGDPWMELILRPIIESAGYQVVPPGAPEAAGAEVAIVSAEEEKAPKGLPGRVVRIRADADAEAEDGSIHRYDRAGLLAALAGKGSA